MFLCCCRVLASSAHFYKKVMYATKQINIDIATDTKICTSTQTAVTHNNHNDQHILPSSSNECYQTKLCPHSHTTSTVAFCIPVAICTTSHTMKQATSKWLQIASPYIGWELKKCCGDILNGPPTDTV